MQELLRKKWKGPFLKNSNKILLPQWEKYINSIEIILRVQLVYKIFLDLNLRIKYIHKRFCIGINF